MNKDLWKKYEFLIQLGGIFYFTTPRKQENSELCRHAACYAANVSFRRHYPHRAVEWYFNDNQPPASDDLLPRPDTGGGLCRLGGLFACGSVQPRCELCRNCIADCGLSYHRYIFLCPFGKEQVIIISKRNIMKNLAKKTSKIRTPYIWADSRRCEACWNCIAACPNHVIGKVNFLWHKHIVIQNGENCTGCKKCIKICPQNVFFETKSSNS